MPKLKGFPVHRTKAAVAEISQIIKAKYGIDSLQEVVKNDPFLALVFDLMYGDAVQRSREVATKTAESIWSDHDYIDFCLHKKRLTVDTHSTQK